MLPQRIEAREVEGRADTGSYDRGECTPPKLLEGVGTRYYITEGCDQRYRPRLLNPSLQ